MIPGLNRGIYLAESGYWWARSPLRAGYVYSLHTKDYWKALAKYEDQVGAMNMSDQPTWEEVQSLRRTVAELGEQIEAMKMVLAEASKWLDGQPARSASMYVTLYDLQSAIHNVTTKPFLQKPTGKPARER